MKWVSVGSLGDSVYLASRQSFLFGWYVYMNCDRTTVSVQRKCLKLWLIKTEYETEDISAWQRNKRIQKHTHTQNDENRQTLCVSKIWKSRNHIEMIAAWTFEHEQCFHFAFGYMRKHLSSTKSWKCFQFFRPHSISKWKRTYKRHDIAISMWKIKY